MLLRINITYLAQNTLHIRTKNISRIRTRGIIRNRLGGCSRVPKHTRPLLDSLVVVLRVERRVRGAVVDPHARAGTRVSGISLFRLRGPVVLAQVQLALRTGAVPPVHGPRVEARVRDPGVGYPRGEDVGVGGC